MASSSKIHLFKKSAIEAGTPEDYYLNPSDNLWTVAKMWRVVEHEDLLVVTVDFDGLGDEVMTLMNGENNEKAARFVHKDGMKKFSIELNPNFLQLGFKLDPTIRLSDGIQRMLIFKIKASAEKKVAGAV